MANSNLPARKGQNMPKGLAEKPKALAALAEKFEDMVEIQRKKLGKEEFQKAEQNFDRIVNKARASRGRRRETA
jgi:hypothetical protein